jgi:hypothetical protein
VQAADYVYRKDKHGNPSDAGSIVGGMVGSLSAIALSMVVGPFAGPLGMGIGFLTTEAWDAFRNVLQKYKEKYKAKKEQSSERLAAQVVPGKPLYKADSVSSCTHSSFTSILKSLVVGGTVLRSRCRASSHRCMDCRCPSLEAASSRILWAAVE